MIIHDICTPLFLGSDHHRIARELPEKPKLVLNCSGGSPFITSPYDCHSFYRCFNEHATPLKMSCGFLMFNPRLGTCDWPSNAIRVRQECGSSFSYFSTENPNSIPQDEEVSWLLFFLLILLKDILHIVYKMEILTNVSNQKRCFYTYCT